MNHLIQLALIAQEAAPADPNAAGRTNFSLGLMVFMFALVYLLMIRPQQKRAKEHDEMVAALKPGDEVITNSGIFGKITRVGEDAITLEVAEKVKIRVVPSSVGRKVGGGEAEAK